MKKILPFLAILVMAPFASAQDCPKDFIDQLNGSNLTKLQKVNLGKVCQGTSFTMTGRVNDVAPDTTLRDDSPIVISLDWEKPNCSTYKFIMADSPGCDPVKLNKGDQITLTAKFKRYLGFSNDYAEATDGICRK